MSKIAIVATGPSAEGCGGEIDSADFVVRMGTWISQGANKAGQKVNAVAGYNWRTEFPSRSIRDWEYWFLIPLDSVRLSPCFSEPGDVPWILSRIDGRPFRMARRRVNSRVEAYLNKRWPTNNWSRTSAGIATVAMAEDLRLWDEIHLWGFDRTGRGGPEDGYARLTAGQPQPTNDGHNWLGQKFMFAEWVEFGLWCGEPTQAKLVWHNRPDGLVVEDPRVKACVVGA